MRRCEADAYGAAVLCGCLLGLPATAADKNNNADAKKGVDGGALAPGYYTGKLVSVPGSDGAFTVNVETDHFQPNPNAAKQASQEQQQIIRLQTDLANARNPKEYNQRCSAWRMNWRKSRRTPSSRTASW